MYNPRFNNSMYTLDVPDLEEYPITCYNCTEDCPGVIEILLEYY